MDSRDFDFSTLGVRGGQVRSAEGEHNDPIHMTSSFVFDSAEQAARRFSDDEPGNVYSRFTNPTVRTFEERLALLEGAKFCSATASGMAAILTLCLPTLKSGDHVVASRSLFGSTVNVFSKTMGRYGVTTTFVPPDDVFAWEAAMQQNTKLLFLESPSNPMGEIADIGALSRHRGASRRVIGGRQRGLHACATKAARAGRARGGPFSYEVHRWPRTCGRRCRADERRVTG